MKAWPFQDSHQVKKYGEDGASWYVGWVDPDGRRRSESCGPGHRGKRAAEELARKRHGELIAGTYQSNAKKTWKEFRKEYEERIAEGMSVSTRDATLFSLDHFEKHINPVRLKAIKTQTIDDFVAKRRLDRGRKEGDVVSPATVNKDLRHLRAVLRVAHEWEYLPKVPKFRMVKEPGKLPTYVTPDHFAAMYQACASAKMPSSLPCGPGTFWRSLLMTGYMTGWRISEILALDKEDLDLDAGTAITWNEDNKGKRDEKVKLHPLVVEHLRELNHFETSVFPWSNNRRTLDTQFARIQEAAGIKLPCKGKHTHTRFCYTYGFHDLRRAFATMNADRLTADALQALMRHKSYQTTKLYIAMARQMDEAVAGLYVPDVKVKRNQA